MSEDLKNKAALALKISKLAKELGAVKEDGNNQHSKYNFISSNQMVALIRERLEGAGLAILPQIDTYKDESIHTSNNKPALRSTVEMSFEIVDTDTGFSIEKKFVGSDQDTGGKSQAQAITECTKRFYFKLFHVSSKEEVDPDSKTTETGLAPAKSILDFVKEVEENQEWIPQETLNKLQELRKAGKQTAYAELTIKAVKEAGFAKAEAGNDHP